ncbi:MAG: cytochrome c [Gammaproteobacteria bacterium]|nr:cytochrome c [Gammaproteobacteria bacterium]MDH3428636.1 cytochrome c [Gammaproteobacteria bacterium]
MRSYRLLQIIPFMLFACASESQQNSLQDYEEIDAATVLDAPKATPGSFAPERLYLVERGEYLVELLGCGACHTNGALEGVPDFDKSLAGSSIGIAYTTPLGDETPGVIYPPNLTPDEETGLGLWSDQQIERAIRVGVGRHSGRKIAIMPWQGYTKMTEEDVAAIVSYLRSIKPVRHKVPDEVKPGQKAKHPFVYFGVYRSRDGR